MKIVVMSITILSILVAPAYAASSKKTKVKECSSYTYYTGTTKTTCKTR